MAHDVFVSYPNVDKATADAVVNSLENAGVRCWVAPRDVPHGSDWAGSIVEAIAMSRMLVLVFSDGTNQSDHILREVRAAGDADIPIVPFRTTAAEPSPSLKYYIGGTHWLDAMSGPMEQHLGTLVTVVERMLADDGPGERPKPAKPMSTIAQPSSEPWWSRLSTASRVGVGAAAVAVVGLVGVLIANSGDDGESISDLDGSTSTTVEVVEDTTAVTDAPGVADSAPEPAASAQLSVEIVPSLFGIAIWDAPSKLCELGGGTIACVDVSPVTERIHTGVAFGDFDEDGLTDAVFATSGDSDTGAEWCRNFGSPFGFECRSFDEFETADRSGSGSGPALAVADLDGDDHLDVVFGNDTNGRSSVERADVCLGDGSGEFECRVLPDAELDPNDVGTAPPNVNAIAVEDLDGDGVLDVVLAGGTVHEVCFGVGDGTFECSTITSERDFLFQDVAIGDLDGDGALDLALASIQTPSRVCFNSGARSFECEDASEPFSDIGALGTADLDSDGATDLLFVQHPNFETGDDSHVSVCFGPLRPGGLCEHIRVPETGSLNLDNEKLVVEDLTGDGLTDLLLLSGPTSPVFCPGVGDGAVECSAFDPGLFSWLDASGFGINVYPSDMAWAPTASTTDIGVVAHGSAQLTVGLGPNFIGAEGFAPDTDIAFEIFLSDGSLLLSETFRSDPTGTVWVDSVTDSNKSEDAYLLRVDLRWGMSVTVDDGTTRKELELSEGLAVIDVDLGRGRASGTAPEELDLVKVGVGPSNGDECGFDAAVQDGAWSVVFDGDPCVQLLPDIAYLALRITDEDGDGFTVYEMGLNG